MANAQFLEQNQVELLVLKAEHELVDEANEWVGTSDNHGEDVQYILGVNAMADRMMRKVADIFGERCS